MPAGKWNPTIEEGATFTRVITVYDDDDEVVNITGYKIRFQAKALKDDEAYVIDLDDDDAEISLSDPTNGQFTITISATVAAAYTFTSCYHQVELESPGGVVTRLLEGKITLSKEL